jgi:hypothetical protein
MGQEVYVRDNVDAATKSSDDVAKERREVTYDTIGSRMMDPSIRWRVEGVVCMMQVANEKAVRLESGWSRRSKVCMTYV